MRISVVIMTLSVLMAIAISGCLENEKTPADLLEPKEKSEAGVTINAVYLGGNAFDIKLDTHSGSLDYEMAKISYIRDSKGNIIKPDAWDGGIGGHHFEGTLTFPKFDDSKGFELVIQNVAGVKERVLKW